jgi:DNA-binding MarR family transcriptional regulator
MDASPTLPIGQLLGQLLHSFRAELHRRAHEGGYDDIREAHLQVFGAIDWTGTRLTDLAARSNMTLPAMAELVDDLQQAGYLERRPDPGDRRAKLVRPTRKGRRFLVGGLRAVRDIEAAYAATVGPERFAAMMGTLQDLVDAQPGAWRARQRSSSIDETRRPGARSAAAGARGSSGSRIQP